MKEIAAVKPNGFTVVSTFSGCGGSCLGFRMTGFKVLWASEFIPAARETYLANYPKTHVDSRDIRKVTVEDVRSVIGDVEVDVLEGSPPCASFSTAGKRSAGWGEKRKYSETVQQVDDLFFEFARILRGLQPKTFVAENVSGLVKGVAKGYFLEILRELKSCGYEIKAKVLDAQWLGVPQMRQRVIFIGVRNDLVKKFDAHAIHPAPLSYRYSVKDAIPWIDRAWEDTGGDFSYGDCTNQPTPTVRAGGVGHLKAKSKTEIIVSAHDYKKVGKNVELSPAPTIKGTPDSSSGKLRSTKSPWKIQQKFDRVLDVSKPTPSIMTHDRGRTGLHLKHKIPAETERRVDESRPSPTVMAHGRGFNGIVVGKKKAKIRVARGFKAEDWVDADSRPFPTVGSEPSFGCNLNNNGGKIRTFVGSVENADSYIDPRPRPVSMVAPTIGASPSSGNGRMPPSKVTKKRGAETVERKLTIDELKRICAFPDDFIITGSYAQQWERLGRAVPPLMMRAVAECVREVLQKCAG